MNLAMQVTFLTFINQITDDNCDQIINLLINDHIIMHSTCPRRCPRTPYFNSNAINSIQNLDSQEEKVAALQDFFRNCEISNDLLIMCPSLAYDAINCYSFYQGDTHASISLDEVAKNQQIFQNFVDRLGIMGGEMVMNLTLHDS
jgi:hypothetical protein